MRNIVLWLIALSILNTSIDVADLGNFHSSASASMQGYNEIESITEFIFSEALNQPLPDNEGADQQAVIKKAGSFDFSIPEKKEKLIPAHLLYKNVKKTAGYYHSELPPGFSDYFTPPPDRHYFSSHFNFNKRFHCL